MKKKLSVNQIRLLLCIVIAAIFLSSYQFIYQRYENLAESYDTDTTSVKLKIDQRNAEIAQVDTVKAKTKEITGQCEDIINKYPVNIAKEDDLIYVEDLKKAMNIKVPSSDINIADNKVIYKTILPIRDENGNEIIVAADASKTSDLTAASITPAASSDTAATSTDTSTASTDTSTDTSTASMDTSTDTSTDSSSAAAGTSTETGDGTTAVAGDNTAALSGTDTTGTTAASGQQYMTCMLSQVTISFKTTNQKFLNVVKYINDNKVKTSISDASLKFDSSTGKLVATMKINRYALTGTGKVYEEPNLGNISIGTDNLFGSDTN